MSTPVAPSIDWASILRQGNADWFGHKDYYYARDQGVTNMQIKKYLDKIGQGNVGGVRMGNVGLAGGGNIGGVYNIVKQGAAREQNQAYQDTIADMQTQLADATKKYEDQQAQYESAYRDTSSVSQGGRQPTNSMTIAPDRTPPSQSARDLERPRGPLGGGDLSGRTEYEKRRAAARGGAKQQVVSGINY
tara:strand:- start:748 stop:1317 length:570 start_codon:yes stop_codon:yes gene_type:complete